MVNVIYKITSPTGKCYIGRTNNFEDRMTQHKYNALTKKMNFALYRAIRKYGWDSMSKEIICEVDEKYAAKTEKEFIIAYNSFKKGYNISLKTEIGGDVWDGRYDTDEYIEFCEKMSEKMRGKNNGMTGKHHTKSTKQKLKQKAKGRFSLDWFIQRYGAMEGTHKYNERRTFLSNRKLKKDETGRFVKSA